MEDSGLSNLVRHATPEGNLMVRTASLFSQLILPVRQKGGAYSGGPARPQFPHEDRSEYQRVTIFQRQPRPAPLLQVGVAPQFLRAGEEVPVRPVPAMFPFQGIALSPAVKTRRPALR